MPSPEADVKASGPARIGTTRTAAGHPSGVAPAVETVPRRTLRLALRTAGPATIVFVLTCALTVLIAAVPALRFTFFWPRARLPIETAGAGVAALAAAFAYFRYSLTGVRTFLFVALAFIAVGLNQFVLGVTIAPGAPERHLHAYFWTMGRLEMAALLLVGASARSRRRRTGYRPLRDLLTGSALTVGVLAAGEALVWLFRGDLPPLVSSTVGSPAAFTGWDPGLTPTDFVLALLGASALLVAAAAYARPDEEQGPGSPLLAPALVLAAFSHLHYMLTPTIFSGWISTGDLLRLAFSGTLLVGLMLEVRCAYQAERDRMCELAAAYADERRRVEKLEGLDRARAELFRMISHELMHPVSAVRSWIVTLERRWSDFDEHQKLDILHLLDVESQRLRDVAERAPEVGGPHALVFPLVPRKESISDLVHEVCSSVAGSNVRLAVHVAPDLRASFVRADGTRIIQVLWNLLSNAAKHGGTDPLVELTVRLSDSDAVFLVADNGPGIPPEDLQRVFDLGYRVPSEDRGPPGAGLGLYVCRGIVEAHGGRIWAESRPGEGARISFTLPLWEERP